MSEDKKTLLTEEGLKKLEDEYYNLVHVIREEVKAELAEARSLGDLSENADYDAARQRQAEVEGRIAQLESILQSGNYEMIKTPKGGRNRVVSVGSTVTLKFLDIDEEMTYSIVGSTEADPVNGKLSNETPLAKAILDHKIGDKVYVNAKEPYEVEILATK